jgi:hypothetical protein
VEIVDHERIAVALGQREDGTADGLLALAVGEPLQRPRLVAERGGGIEWDEGSRDRQVLTATAVSQVPNDDSPRKPDSDRYAFRKASCAMSSARARSRQNRQARPTSRCCQRRTMPSKAPGSPATTRAAAAASSSSAWPIRPFLGIRRGEAAAGCIFSGLRP